MRIITTHKMHSVDNENFIMRQDNNVADLNTVLGFNDSALLLYRSLGGRDFTVADAVKVLCDNYDVPEATAQADVEKWLEEMRTNKLLED